mmetsp:Transcript_9551/g.21937  ORF Transcript_9551/g.21937 Transcript_9551/m.21937 type:complete len:329 (-) Transcript_9551:40-1026(-)
MPPANVGVISVLEGSKSTLGEGALWYHEKQVFLWIDIDDKLLHVFNPRTGLNTTWEFQAKIGTVVPTVQGGVVLAMQDGFYSFDLETSDLTLICNPDAGKTTRFNDGKCDPQGRLWAGTMFHEVELSPLGTLYVLDTDLKARATISPVCISNGIVWVDNIMYYVDTPLRVVEAFDFNGDAGEISNRRPAITLDKEFRGLPDGMTADSEGNLWVAMWKGGCVCQYNPKTGALLRKIDVPALNVTSVAFGGPEMDELYVTSASVDMSEEDRAAYPLAGHTFKITGLGVKGLPAPLFAGDIRALATRPGACVKRPVAVRQTVFNIVPAPAR